MGAKIPFLLLFFLFYITQHYAKACFLLSFFLYFGCVGDAPWPTGGARLPALADNLKRRKKMRFVNELAESFNCTLGVPWIWRVFGQCVDSPVEYAAFIIGFISFLLWLLPVIPQIYQNYKRGHCDDALSIYFLLFWFIGDSLNLTGAILCTQLPIQVYIGVYFIFQDCVILAQYFYYKIRGGWRVRLLHDLGPPTLSCLMLVSFVGTFGQFDITRQKREAGDYAELFDEGAPGNQPLKAIGAVAPFFNGTKDKVGFILGSLSALCYLAGRLPQLYKNLRRKSTEGVSVLMFLIIIAGNLTYGLAVLLSGDTFLYVLHHMPWLLGSFGCCLLDILVLWQYFAFKNRRRIAENVETLGNGVPRGGLEDTESTDDGE